MRDRRTLYYRYISKDELISIFKKFKVESLSGITYFTYERFDDANEAQRRLALSKRPEYRIGPIPEEHMPYIPYKGTVPPTKSAPGGAPEIYITEPLFLVPELDPVYLLGIYKFDFGDEKGRFIKPCCEVRFGNEVLVEKLEDLSKNSYVSEEKLNNTWEVVKDRYRRIEGELRRIAESWGLKLRPFPWDEMYVELVGRGFLIRVDLKNENNIELKLVKWRGGKVSEEESIGRAESIEGVPSMIEETLREMDWLE